jgi:hypothetical protein
MRIHPLVLLFVAPIATLAVAGAAAASGGTSIAKAPLLASTAKLSGDTTSDLTTPGDNGIGFDSGCWHDLEFWRVELGAGDAATFSGGGIDPGDNFELGIFPPGTTDANLAKANSVKNGFPKQRSVVYDAVAPGEYIVVAGPNCYNGVDGPFEIAVSIAHNAAPVATEVTLPAKVPASGPVAVTVKGPGGLAITDPKLVLKLYGMWGGASHLLGSASPSAGSARFSVRLPANLKGTKIGLQVTGSGTGYIPVKSATLQRPVT